LGDQAAVVRAARSQASCALDRADAYHQAVADCLFPIVLWQRDALTASTSSSRCCPIGSQPPCTM
jgi:2-methylisocitrate lyase-like PEP mutase family enzyme